MPGNNAPEFDPLNATEEDGREMVAGYRDAFSNAPPPPITSAAYDHGRRMGANDKAGVIDDDQRKLAHRLLNKKG